VTLGLKGGADIGSPATLPNDGVMDRSMGAAVPDDRGFPLIGDSNTSNVSGIDLRFGQGTLQCPSDGC